jgi:hypothetical protein
MRRETRGADLMVFAGAHLIGFHPNHGSETMFDQLLERCVNYMLQVQCKHCSTEVYPDEDEARDRAEYWIEYDDVHNIEDLKARIDRTCDGCSHFLGG